MLVDAVSSAKFLTLDDSRKLVKKIKKLATKEGERLIDATMIMDSELKPDDKKFNIKFVTIMRAIADHKQIRFQYHELGEGNKKALKRDGYVYQVSPYFIVLSNEEYYLIGNSITNSHATHFRIEMITRLEMCDEPSKPMNEIEELKNIGQEKDICDYLRESVHMWSGEITDVTLKASNNCRHDVLSKFGKNIMMRDDGQDGFVAHIKVADSAGFYQWVASYGSNITIQSPIEMRETYVEYLKVALSNYV